MVLMHGVRSTALFVGAIESKADVFTSWNSGMASRGEEERTDRVMKWDSGQGWGCCFNQDMVLGAERVAKGIQRRKGYSCKFVQQNPDVVSACGRVIKPHLVAELADQFLFFWQWPGNQGGLDVPKFAPSWYSSCEIKHWNDEASADHSSFLHLYHFRDGSRVCSKRLTNGCGKRAI